jgi:hypothetical protein
MMMPSLPTADASVDNLKSNAPDAFVRKNLVDQSVYSTVDASKTGNANTGGTSTGTSAFVRQNQLGQPKFSK